MRKFLAVLAILAGTAMYVCPAHADVPTIYSNYGQPLSSTAATGTSSVLFPNGQGSCVVEITSIGGATVTVRGTVKTDGTNQQTNTAFGTSGVISATGVYQGSIASYPGNFYFTWTGNTGTLTYTEACSGPVGSSSGSGGGGGGGSVTVTNFPASFGSTQSTTPWVDNLTQWGSVSLGGASAIGTPATGNIPTIQGNASGVPLPVSGSVTIGGTLPTSILPYAATNAQTAVANSFVGSVCTYSSSPPTLTNGQVNPVQCDPAAKLYADVIGTVTVANTPAPALQAGSGGTNLSSTMEDTRTETGSITTATTTLVKAGTAGQRIFVSYAAFDSSGTNTAATFVFIQGTTTTTPCDTNASNLWLDSETVYTGALAITPAYSGAVATAASGSVGIIPAAKEWPLTTGYSLCITTAGTTVAGNAVVLSATHL